MPPAGFIRAIPSSDTVHSVLAAVMRATGHKATTNAADRQIFAPASAAPDAWNQAPMKPLFGLHRLTARDGPRITLAIAFSGVLHVLLLMLVPASAEHVDYLMVQAARPALSVDIAPPDAPPAPAVSRPRRIELNKPSTPVQEARTETPVAVVQEAPATPAPPAPAPVISEPATYAGVYVAPTLYLGPLPPRAIEFEGSAEFLREPVLDEAPVAVTVAIPEYPEAAEGRKDKGTVLVAIFIDEEGHVVRTAVVESSEHVFQYSRQVAQAMANSVFTPGKRGGKAVKSLVFQVVHLDPAMPAPGP